MIATHYERLLAHCARKFKDQNCEDTVGDFVLKVLTKPNFYPDTIKNETEEWRWTVVCFDRFKIDKLRAEKVRDVILNTASINTNADKVKRPSDINSCIEERHVVQELYSDSVEISHEYSDEEYHEHACTALTDEIYTIYQSLTPYDKRIFQLVYFCKYTTNETTSYLKDIQPTTKRDVVLALILIVYE